MRFFKKVVLFFSILTVSLALAHDSFAAQKKRSSPVANFSQFFGHKKSKVTRVPITQGHVVKDPIAFVPLYGHSSKEQDVGRQFMEVVKADLCGCGLFAAIPSEAFLQNSEQLVSKEPRLQDWGVTKARFLICGQVVSSNLIKLRVYDVNCGIKLMTLSTEANTRKQAHQVADQIFSRITGEKGMFDTQIAYVETVPARRIHGHMATYLRRLKMMDQDGFHDIALSDGNDLVMTPRFSPDGKKVAYLVYQVEGHGKNRKRTAQVYLMDLATRKNRPLLTQNHLKEISKASGGGQVNMSYAPRFSPDGKSLCFALIINGKSAIYTMDLTRNSIRRLTSHVAIDTSPAYSHDGTKIVFTSNRSGKEKIYIMNTDGTCVRRVTYGEGKYSQPVFSPRGDFIAFSKQIGNLFFIGVVRPNGQEERMITQGYLTESPCWSSNGRYIAFTRQSSPKSVRRICIIDLTGYFMKELVTKQDAYDCTWSPLQG